MSLYCDPIPLRKFLDPRSRAESVAKPIADAVNIPLDELPSRTHELPSRNREIQVAGPEATAILAVNALQSLGRIASPSAEWEYGPSEQPGRLWEPNAFLQDVLPASPGRALDLACGTGRDAVYLAAHGWHVTAIDILPDALEKARRLERTSLGNNLITFIAADLESPSLNIEGKFDLLFSAFFLHRPLFGLLPNLLNHNGLLIAETFTTQHRAKFSRPQSDAHILLPGELPKLVPQMEIELYQEGWHEGRCTGRLVARKK